MKWFVIIFLGVCWFMVWILSPADPLVPGDVPQGDLEFYKTKADGNKWPFRIVELIILCAAVYVYLAY